MTPWASCSARPRPCRLWAMPQARPTRNCNAASRTATTNLATAPTPACLMAAPCTGCSMARATCTRSTSLQRKALTSLPPPTRSLPTWNATPCTAAWLRLRRRRSAHRPSRLPARPPGLPLRPHGPHPRQPPGTRQPAGPRTVCLRPRRQPAGLHPRQRRPARGHHSWRGGRQPPALLPRPAL